MGRVTKKKTDPKLTTSNAYLQHTLGLASGSLGTLMGRRFESLICEQIWLAKKAPPKFIRSQKDGDGYLKLDDIVFPVPVFVAPKKSLNWLDLIEKPMSKLCWNVMNMEAEALGVTHWAGSRGSYAQMGILKRPEDDLRGYMEAPLIRRGYDGDVYYLGRLFDILQAMVTAGSLPTFAQDYGE